MNKVIVNLKYEKMMKKSFYLSLFAGVLLAACSSSDMESTFESEVLQHRQMPVDFNTFLGSNASTRSGATGILTSTELEKATSKGFGVFAYYTDNTTYNATSSLVNFMYNEQVKYETSKWTYTPLKYWPNEYGTNAVSTQVDYLSFQAYAPWVGVEDGTNVWQGGLTEGTIPEEVGITGFSNSDGSKTDNTVTGDVYVNYTVASDPTNSVDLLYATNANTAYNVTTPNDGLLNMTKQPVNTPVTFKFAHALSRLGVKIRAVVDKTTDADSDLATGSTIVLNSITIQSDAMGKQGKLNLRTGEWTVTGEDYSLIIEGANIKLSGTNENEVTTSYQEVMGADKYFMFIPTNAASTTFNVTVDYTVTTNDIALVTGKSVVNNRITNTLTFTPEKSKAYNLNVLIGLTSVVVQGEVSNWDNTPASSEIWVPINR